jgi:hypothetical protein
MAGNFNADNITDPTQTNYGDASMKMSAVIAGLAVALLASVVNAQGQPSSSKLAKMGLSSMRVVTDSQGEQVRGRGFGAGFFTIRMTLTEGVFNTTTNQFVNNTANTITATATNAFTWGQDPRATPGAVVAGTGGFNPVTPGSPVTINLATPQGIWTASGFGIGFGNGN